MNFVERSVLEDFSVKNEQALLLSTENKKFEHSNIVLNLSKNPTKKKKSQSTTSIPMVVY